MTAAALRAIEEAMRSNTWSTAEKVKAVVMMPELKAELTRNRRAREHFRPTPMLQKRQFL